MKLNDISGQSDAVSALCRVRDGDLTKPLLLVGEEGVGKKASALAAIREMILRDSAQPEQDELLFDTGCHPDVHLLTPVAGKEFGVDVVRDLIQSLSQHPNQLPYRFVVLDGADKLTTAAANGLLKTIEEPPTYARLFLIARTPEGVIPTILSRCGLVRYGRLSEQYIYQRMVELETNTDKAWMYTRLGQGSLGKSIRLWSEGKIQVRDAAFQALGYLAEGNLSQSFASVDSKEKDLDTFLHFAISLAHDLLLVKRVPSKVINQDLLEDLHSNSAGLELWERLWLGLKEVYQRNESSYVNLSFQLKAALAGAYGVQ